MLCEVISVLWPLLALQNHKNKTIYNYLTPVKKKNRTAVDQSFLSLVLNTAHNQNFIHLSMKCYLPCGAVAIKYFTPFSYVTKTGNPKSVQPTKCWQHIYPSYMGVVTCHPSFPKTENKIF